MQVKRKKWFIKKVDADYKTIATRFGISETLARLAVNRGIRSNEEMEVYLDPSIEQMNDPHALKDMEKACNILLEKIRDKKRIRIVGDYDVDGVMSVYILQEGLKTCGAYVDHEIPERVKDGYGINLSIIEAAYRDEIDTIITCDNGIAAYEQIKRAKELGITVIITDHHDVPYVMKDEEKQYIIPEADAVVNPKQMEEEYPFSGICGAVVAYKLIEVLFERFDRDKEELYRFLEFAAIATVCDVMDLKNENRAIVKLGLKRINETQNTGLKALLDQTQLSEKRVGVYHLGFIIGPCINASGRLETAKLGLSLFLETDRIKADAYAKQLKELNEERKEMTNQGLLLATELIENSTLLQDKVLVVYLCDCHESLAGIIAGRIKERYQRPAIVLTKVAEGVKGSARSIEEYNMFEELNRCKDLLTKFGGHPMAAGLSLEEDNIEILRKRLNEQTILSEEDFKEKIVFDMVLSLNQIDYSLVNEISLLEPFGKGNLRPLFALKQIKVIKAIVLGKNQNVLRLTITEENNPSSYTAMIFQNVDRFEEIISDKYGQESLQALYNGKQSEVMLDIIFYPEQNEFNGMKSLQIIIQDFQ